MTSEFALYLTSINGVFVSSYAGSSEDFDTLIFGGICNGLFYLLTVIFTGGGITKGYYPVVGFDQSGARFGFGNATFGGKVTFGKPVTGGILILGRGGVIKGTGGTPSLVGFAGITGIFGILKVFKGLGCCYWIFTGLSGITGGAGILIDPEETGI